MPTLSSLLLSFFLTLDPSISPLVQVVFGWINYFEIGFTQ
jgi:hypothetical protein